MNHFYLKASQKFSCYLPFLLLILYLNPRVYAQWNPQNSGTNYDLESVFFLDSQIGYASGEYGTIIKTTSGGLVWENISPGPPNAVDKIVFTAANTGYAFARGGLILKTTNGGTTWDNLNYSGDAVILRDACFTDANTGYAVGHAIVPPSYGARIVQTTDAGTSWITLEIANEAWLYDVHFPATDVGYAIGTSNISGNCIWKTTDAGNSWPLLTSGISGFLNDIYFTDIDTGYLVVGGRILKTTDGGINWNQTFYNQTFSLSAIYFGDNTTGYAVGEDVFDETGLIVKTADSGINWQQQNIDSTAGLSGLFFINPNVGWAVGSNGTILTTTNGGGTTDINDQQIADIPLRFSLAQNYPNPFNPSTTIRYNLPSAEFVTLKVYDVLGREVVTLVNEQQTAGSYGVQFDASQVASGLYFYKITTASFNSTRKMVVMK